MTTPEAHSAEPFHLTPVWLQRWPLARPTIKCLDLLGIAILGPGRCTAPGVHLVAGRSEDLAISGRQPIIHFPPKNGRSRAA